MLQTVVVKVFNTLATFIAAWFLLPEDYKFASLVFPITMFASVFQQLGVDKALISRGTEGFEKWANAGFWMSATAGMMSGVLIVLAAPVAARIYQVPSLEWLLWILAIIGPLSGLTTVQQAWLQHQLKFKFLAILGTGSGLLQCILLVWMAAAGCGVYALVVPITAGVVVRSLILLKVVRIPLRFAPELRSWRFLVKDSFLSMATQCMFLVAAQGDFLLLGLVLPKKSDLLGYFSFAFTLSIAVITPLILNLVAVMFPALSTLAAEPKRQIAAYLLASRRLAVVGVPLCLLQAAAAPALLEGLYGHRWDPAIPALRILSVCMAIRVVAVSNGALFPAQKRFALQFVLATVYAIVFLAAVYYGATFGTITAIAIAETVFFLIFDNVNLFLAIRPGGGTVKDILKLYFAPFASGCLAIGAGLLIAQCLPALRWAEFAKVGIISIVGLGGYVLLIFRLDHQSFVDVVGQFSRWLPSWLLHCLHLRHLPSARQPL
jgi:PST family polysaccharide transporter